MIKSFCRYTAVGQPGQLGRVTQVLAIRQKKTPPPQAGHLNGDEVRTLLAAPGTASARAVRDTVLLALAYDTAVRARELCDLDVADIRRGSPVTVVIHGKGAKVRYVPVTDPTARLAGDYLDRRERHLGTGADADPLFAVRLRPGRVPGGLGSGGRPGGGPARAPGKGTVMKWNLRLAAAGRSIWKASELQQMLVGRGLVISAGKMSGLWSGNPSAVKLSDLDVICAVLGCGIGELLIPGPVPEAPAGGGRQPKAAAATASVALRRATAAPFPAVSPSGPAGSCPHAPSEMNDGFRPATAWCRRQPARAGRAPRTLRFPSLVRDSAVGLSELHVSADLQVFLTHGIRTGCGSDMPHTSRAARE